MSDSHDQPDSTDSSTTVTVAQFSDYNSVIFDVVKLGDDAGSDSSVPTTQYLLVASLMNIVGKDQLSTVHALESNVIADSIEDLAEVVFGMVSSGFFSGLDLFDVGRIVALDGTLIEEINWLDYMDEEESHYTVKPEPTKILH